MLFKANWLIISPPIHLLITPRSLFSSSDFSLVFQTCICSLLLIDVPQTQHVQNLISLLHIISLICFSPSTSYLVTSIVRLIIKKKKKASSQDRGCNLAAYLLKLFILVQTELKKKTNNFESTFKIWDMSQKNKRFRILFKNQKMQYQAPLTQNNGLKLKSRCPFQTQVSSHFSQYS